MLFHLLPQLFLLLLLYSVLRMLGRPSGKSRPGCAKLVLKPNLLEAQAGRQRLHRLSVQPHAREFRKRRGKTRKRHPHASIPVDFVLPRVSTLSFSVGLPRRAKSPEKVYRNAASKVTQQRVHCSFTLYKPSCADPCFALYGVRSSAIPPPSCPDLSSVYARLGSLQARAGSSGIGRGQPLDNAL